MPLTAPMSAPPVLRRISTQMNPIAFPRRRIAAATIVAVAAWAAPAWAQERVAPPGNSGVSQYFEVVPTAKGNAAPGSGAVSVPARARRELGQRGRSGRRLEELLRRTAPPRRKPKLRPKPASREEARLDSVVESLSAEDGSGMGLALPALLVASTAALALIAARRRRSDGS